MFRDLKASEIECRAAMVKANGIQLLLYKDARCDMNILDETVGAMKWERRHSRDNANCTVSVWDDGLGMWISKEDTGTESNTEKAKGLASDSFKRACFNWGIGRELYTAPFIWVNSNDCTIKGNNGRYTSNDKFFVSKIKVKEKTIVELEITRKAKDGKKQAVVYKYKTTVEIAEKAAEETEPDISGEVIKPNELEVVKSMMEKHGMKTEKLTGKYKIDKLENMTAADYVDFMALVNSMYEKD